MRPLIALFCAGAVGSAAPIAARAANLIKLAAHHAEYQLALKPSADQGVIAATGRMTYDVRDVCTGWSTSQHLVINLTNADGRDIRMESDYATLEAKDGTRLEFHTRQATDGRSTEQLDGTASLERPGGRGQASFTNPQNTRVDLPAGTLLPMAHTVAILDAATGGQKFFSAPLFDGTGSDGPQDTFVVLEGWRKPLGGKWPSLAPLYSSRVHIAFFDRSPTAATPSYQFATRYFSNGVADDLTMNFGDFVMDGKLSQLETRPPSPC